MKKILVPVDFSEISKYGAELAVELAERSNAEIIFMYCMQFDDFKNHAQQAESDLRATIDEVKELALNKLVEFVEGVKKQSTAITRISSDPLQDSIIESIQEDQISMVVMGTKGSSGLSELLVGSNTERIVRWAECPVISVPALVSCDSIKKILVPLDLEEIQDEFMVQLVKLQKFFTAEIHFVWIKSAYYFDQELVMKEFKDLLNNYGFEKAELSIAQSESVEHGIFNLAAEVKADMVSMATHARRGISHWFSGSITEDTINSIKIPVWTFKLNKSKKYIKISALEHKVKEPQGIVKRKFKSGDTVVLKSGGPKMTVDNYVWKGNHQSHYIVSCYWFEGNRQMSAEFNQDSIQYDGDS